MDFRDKLLTQPSRHTFPPHMAGYYSAVDTKDFDIRPITQHTINKIRHVSPPQAHRQIHIRLPGRERLQGRPHAPANHPQSGPA